MKRPSGPCPACGAPVEFKVGSSLVTICQFCNSAVARVDKKLEDHGKVADLVETFSPLEIGASGRFGRRVFTVVGRCQYQHPAGGVWDEWYLAFAGDRWGWLAEAQGKFLLTYEKRLPRSFELPEFDALSLGNRFDLGKGEFTVTEKGIATAKSAQGDLPWDFVPGKEHRFVDLAGDEQFIATIEYGESPKAYIGKEVTLADLELDEALPVYAQAKRAKTQQLNCPKCGGPLELFVPDQAQRITCGNCNSLLDASQGKLAYLQTLETHRRAPIYIPLGSEGEILGDPYTVIGFLRRYAMYEGTTYPWSEYLMYNRKIGFRWLVHNNGHWSFVEPVSGHVDPYGSSIRLDGKRFRIYDRGTAHVQHVFGEFYWKVSVGETVQTADYIDPPQMLSIETSFTTKSEEINVSLGTYLKPETVETAFGIPDTGRSWGVGMIQPRPAIGYGVFLLWFVFMIAIGAISAFFGGTSSGKVDPWMAFYAILFVSLVPAGALIFMYAFEVKRWENSDYSPYRSE